ncbi:metallophosphoesterase [Anaerotruncus massiliensis (ex Togo et al. 2019)]
MEQAQNTVYLTGDTHGRFDRVIDFCLSKGLTHENMFIILGDAGLNYFGDGRDTLNKEALSKLPITFFCIHGNHEMRPGPALGYELRRYHGGQVWVQPEYPNIKFAIDGEIYEFCGHACLVIGGAYSVDKYYRLARGWNWWADEQPSPEIKAKVDRVLSKHNWQVDVELCVVAGALRLIRRR